MALDLFTEAKQKGKEIPRDVQEKIKNLIEYDVQNIGSRDILNFVQDYSSTNDSKSTLGIIDEWDSLWDKTNFSLNLFILENVKITIYEISSFNYRLNETFYQIIAKDKIEENLPSISLSFHLGKIQNSSLNIFSVFGLNSIFALDFNHSNFSDHGMEYKEKLKKVKDDKELFTIASNSFNHKHITDQWKTLLNNFLNMNGSDLVHFLKLEKIDNEV